MYHVKCKIHARRNCPMSGKMPQKHSSSGLLHYTSGHMLAFQVATHRSVRFLRHNNTQALCVATGCRQPAVRSSCANYPAGQSHAALLIPCSGKMKSVGFGHCSDGSYGGSDTFDAGVSCAKSRPYFRASASYSEFA